jgi:hypothetical protein
MPAGTTPPEGAVVLAIEDGLTLPLLVLWPAGRPAPAVQALLEAMPDRPGAGGVSRRAASPSTWARGS